MDINEIKRKRQAYNLCQTTDICSGNLGIGRSSMPQIDKSHMEMFLDKLEQHDIDVHRNEHVPANRLKATQGEINGEKVEEMPESKIGKKPLLISSDYHLLDGHHQWAKAMLINPKMNLLVNRIDLPIKQLLTLTKSYEHTKYKDIDDNKLAKIVADYKVKKAARELLKVAREIMASGSATIDPMFVKKANDLVDEQVDILQEKSDNNKEIRRNGLNLSKFEQEAKKAIEKAREDLRPELAKDFKSVLDRAKDAISNPELASELEDWLWERQRELRKNDSFDIQDSTKSSNTYPYQLVLREIDKALSAFSKNGIDDEMVSDTRKFYEKRLKDLMTLVEKFKDHLVPIAREIDFRLEVSAYIDADMLMSQEVNAPTMYVKIRDTMLSITVFVHGNNYVVDDVIDDPDFFHNSETQAAYDGLIHYLRKGQLPKDKPVKFIKLYRAMSSVEYHKWQSGSVIPKNKYFTSKATGDFAYDDPDLAEKLKQDPSFSYGLEQFSVRSDCVAERDSAIYITVKECKLENGKIVPV